MCKRQKLLKNCLEIAHIVQFMGESFNLWGNRSTIDLKTNKRTKNSLIFDYYQSRCWWRIGDFSLSANKKRLDTIGVVR